jgi:PAS domain S-box-containing protein
MVESKEKYRIIAIAILLAAACYLTYYFHVVRETGTIFTHYFYIPIILAALWWRRKGLSVAIFLALLILFSHIFVREEVLAANDYFRALMFIVIAFVVVTLSERIAKAQEKSDHLNAILGAIRNVNQLIVREKDSDRLIQRTCENLIETRGYYSAWIALVDENQRFLTAAEAGLGESFSPAIEMMKRGEFTRCGLNALKQSGIIIVKDIAADCADCPLVGAYSGRAGMAIRLEHRDMIYGIISVSIPAEMAADADEQSLFNEVAGDIALALRDMELEGARKRAEEALREAKTFAESVISNAMDGIAVIDLEGRLIQFNDAFVKMLGYSGEELRDMHFHQFTPEKWLAEDEIQIGKLLQSIPGVPFEKEFIRKDGLVFPVTLSISLLTDEEGEPTVMMAIIRDETERKRAEEELRLFSHSADSLIDGMAMGNLEGMITYVNETFSKMFGYSREELIGKEIVLIYPEGQMPKLEKALKATMEGGWTGELIGKKKDGELFPMAVTSSRVLDDKGKVIAQMAIHRDITERKKAEEKVKEAYRLQEHFLKETSHRIITPVAIIGGHADLLLESSNLDEDQKEKIRIIRERNKEVQKLVRDALAGKYLEEEEEEGGEG